MDSYGLVRRKQHSEELRDSLSNLPLEPIRPTARNIVHTPVQRAVLLLRRHAWTIVACTLIATSLCLLRAARQPRLYCATADLAIYRDNQPAVPLEQRLHA